MSTLRHAARVAALGLPLCACVSVLPPVAVETPWGVVRGESSHSAQRVAEHLEMLGPRVREMLIDAREGSTEVWVQRVLRRRGNEPSPDEVSGFTRFVDREPLRIYLRDSEDPRWALGHELVHALSGPTWDSLPGVLAEGLADVVAGMASPDLLPRARAVRLLNASLFFGGLAFRVSYSQPDDRSSSYQADVWFRYALDPADDEPSAPLALNRWELNERLEYLPETYYGLGFVAAERIVERHGVEGLHALCLRARDEGRSVVPKAWLFEAAELEDEEDWNTAIAELLGPRELREVNRILPDLMPQLAVLLFAESFGHLDGDDFLRVARPSVVLHDGASVALEELDGVRARLLARWPR